MRYRWSVSMSRDCCAASSVYLNPSSKSRSFPATSPIRASKQNPSRRDVGSVPAGNVPVDEIPEERLHRKPAVVSATVLPIEGALEPDPLRPSWMKYSGQAIAM